MFYTISPCAGHAIINGLGEIKVWSGLAEAEAALAALRAKYPGETLNIRSVQVVWPEHIEIP